MIYKNKYQDYYSIMKIQKPLLKWIGGKTQLIDKIIEKIPAEVNNYHEPFVGGASVLLAVLSMEKQGILKINGTVYASDLNHKLINFYKHLKDNPTLLFEKISEVMNEYKVLTGTEINRKPQNESEAKTSKESYYYYIRKMYNHGDPKTVQAAALFFFLNKTCFRGMYREGPNGFNVPFGNYKTVPILKASDFTDISELIQKVQFIDQDFTQSLKIVKKGDFVYLDPPYAPETKNSFVGYTTDGFDLKTHMVLFETLVKLKCKAKILMSNSNTSLVTDYFKNFTCENVVARRSINSKDPGSKTTEVLIYNY